MKKILLTIIICLAYAGIVNAQWTTSTDTSKIHNTNSGNVGIGTTSPGYRLDVNGNARVASELHLSGGDGSQLNGNGSKLTLTTNGFWDSTQGSLLQLTNSDLNLWTNAGKFNFNNSVGNPFVVFNSTNGNVGIGTSTPSSLFQIGSGGQGVYFSGTPVASGNNYQKAIGFDGYWDGSNWKFPSDGVNNGGFVIANANNGNLNFYYAPNTGAGIQTISQASIQTALTILNSNGNVGIGTTGPDEKLTVNGSIHSTEVKVDLSVPAPDYVFHKTYKLRPLSVVSTFIKANHHLPEISSAKELERAGLNVGEMNMQLLKKVEELTLYLIDQKKEISDLKLAVKKLKK